MERRPATETGTSMAGRVPRKRVRVSDSAPVLLSTCAHALHVRVKTAGLLPAPLHRSPGLGRRACPGTGRACVTSRLFSCPPAAWCLSRQIACCYLGGADPIQAGW